MQYYLYMNEFQAYIKQVGAKEAAVLFSITERTAVAYARGDRAPRLCAVPRLIKASNGHLCVNSFFNERDLE